MMTLKTIRIKRFHAIEPEHPAPLVAEVVGYREFEAGWRNENRNARNKVHLYWCTKGEGTLRFGNERLSLKKDMIAIYGPKDVHELEATTRWNFHYLVLSGNCLQELLSSLGLDRIRVEPVGKCPVHLYRLIENSFQDVSMRGHHATSALVYRLLGEIAVMRRVSSDGEEGFVDKAKGLLQKNYHDPVYDILKLSRDLNLHRSRLSRLFKAATGVTLQDYLKNLRIQNALNLLATSDLGISQIASASGFKYAAYFSKSIRQVTGLTPEAFRKQSKV